MKIHAKKFGGGGSKDLREDNDQCKGDRVKGLEVRQKSYWSPTTGGSEPDRW